MRHNPGRAAGNAWKLGRGRFVGVIVTDAGLAGVALLAAVKRQHKVNSRMIERQ
jgi:hypothetical protein